MVLLSVVAENWWWCDDKCACSFSALNPFFLQEPHHHLSLLLWGEWLLAIFMMLYAPNGFNRSNHHLGFRMLLLLLCSEYFLFGAPIP
jgi:hypothetical protein